jgi:alpha-tubulin suppressor-like RCC1 family protein
LTSGKVYVVGSFEKKTYETFTNISSCLNEEIIDFKMGLDKVIMLTKKGEVYQFGLNYRED